MRVGRPFGGQTMSGRLRRVLVRRPDEAFGAADPTAWHYAGRPDLERARQEHDAFVDLLREAGVEVLGHHAPQPGRADAVFVRDVALVTDAGAVILRPGKALRRGEEEAVARRLEALGIPVLYRLHGNATAEGGDMVWLDEQTLAVGWGFRTNAPGLAQLGEALHPLGVRVLPVPLPYHHGPEACLHLMSLISPVDRRAAVVFKALLPVPFWHELRDRGWLLIDVPEEEWDSLGPNVLPVEPGLCIMLEGNPRTQCRLEQAGYRVLTFRGEEICLKAEGGPTCLTLPLLRDPPPPA